MSNILSKPKCEHCGQDVEFDIDDSGDYNRQITTHVDPFYNEDHQASNPYPF